MTAKEIITPSTLHRHHQTWDLPNFYESVDLSDTMVIFEKLGFLTTTKPTWTMQGDYNLQVLRDSYNAAEGLATKLRTTCNDTSVYHYFLDNICHHIETKLKKELKQTSETFSLMPGKVLKQFLKPERETRNVRREAMMNFKNKLQYDQNSISNYSTRFEGNSTYNIMAFIYREFTNSTTKILAAQKEFTTL